MIKLVDSLNKKSEVRIVNSWNWYRNWINRDTYKIAVRYWNCG